MVIVHPGVEQPAPLRRSGMSTKSWTQRLQVILSKNNQTTTILANDDTIHANKWGAYR